MISKEKIEKNKIKFFETNERYQIFTNELIEFLGEDYFLSPASPSLDLYGAYPGGLLDHTLKICKYSLNVNETLPESIRLDNSKILKTVFLSQIGKVFFEAISQGHTAWLSNSSRCCSVVILLLCYSTGERKFESKK